MKKKKIIKEIVIQLIAIFNLLCGVYVLGIIGSLENFIEVSLIQWVMFFAVFIFYFIELFLLKEVENNAR